MELIHRKHGNHLSRVRWDAPSYGLKMQGHMSPPATCRFLRAVEAGELLSPQLTGAFFTPRVRDWEIDDWLRWYSYGLWFYVDRSGDVACCEKEGINAAVSGMIHYFPEQGINVVILSNMRSGAWKPKIHEMIVGEH